MCHADTGEVLGICELATILSADAFESGSAELLEALCVFVFEAGALAEEAGEVLGKVR